MLLMYLKIAFRQLASHKVLSLINVVGLSLGLATCYVILVYVSHQTSVDHYNVELDNTFVVTAFDKYTGWTQSETPVLLGPAIKEIGIRKVLGASIGSIYAMIVKEFLLLILLSAAIGFPLAIWLVGNWMNDFAYTIQIGTMDLLFSLGVGLAVVLVMVSSQVLRVAASNPVNSLRYE